MLQSNNDAVRASPHPTGLKARYTLFSCHCDAYMEVGSRATQEQMPRYEAISRYGS